MFSGWFDGGSRGNPGVSGAGWILRAADDTVVNCGHVFVSLESTNNVAEYRGLLALLQAAQANEVRELHVFGDSKLVIMQVTGRWKINCPHLRVLCQDIQRLVQTFTQCTFDHVLRENNTDADFLSNLAMDTRTTRMGLDLLTISDVDVAGSTADGKAVAVRIQRNNDHIIQGCHVWTGPTWTRNGWRLPKSIWMNPFQFVTPAAEGLRKYKEYVHNNPQLLSQLSTLRGKQLGCICNLGSLCHAVYLAALVNGEIAELQHTVVHTDAHTDVQHAQHNIADVI